MGPIGFSFMGEHLDVILQSSAEVTLRACMPLSVYIDESPFFTKENESYYYEFL